MNTIIPKGQLEKEIRRRLIDDSPREILSIGRTNIEIIENSIISDDGKAVAVIKSFLNNTIHTGVEGDSYLCRIHAMDESGREVNVTDDQLERIAGRGIDEEFVEDVHPDRPYWLSQGRAFTHVIFKDVPTILRSFKRIDDGKYELISTYHNFYNGTFLNEKKHLVDFDKATKFPRDYFSEE